VWTQEGQQVKCRPILKFLQTQCLLLAQSGHNQLHRTRAVDRSGRRRNDPPR